VEKRIINYDFHLQLSYPDLTDKENTIMNLPRENSHIVPFYEDKCLIKSSSNTKVTQIRAFYPDDYRNSFFWPTYKMIIGGFPEKNGIVLAENLASTLHAGIGDEVTLLVIDNSIGANHYTQRKFRVDGIISLGYAAYDTVASFMTKKDADSLFLIENNSINKIGFYFENEATPLQIKQFGEILQRDNPKAFVNNIYNNKVFKDFFEEKKSLSLAMLIILLIAFIAIFITINVALADKLKDLAILKVIGIYSRKMLFLFLGQGLYIATIGSIFGFFFGTLVLLNLDRILSFVEIIVNNFFSYTNLLQITNFPSYYKWQAMPDEVYYISSLPYKIIWKDFLIEGIGAYLCAIIAALVPSFKLLRMNLIENLRNE
jgi:lipoprotein-releasing system permease protein